MKSVSLFSTHLVAGLLLLLFPLSGSAQKLRRLPFPPDVEFASGESARRIPFEFVGNHIYLQGQVNNSAPLWFLLDTGAAGSYFDARQAKALGLGTQGETKTTKSLRFHA